MADPFQPKFVDLVRNNSDTAGTGNFILGDAPAGFKSFTTALKPGDGFYYSAIGIDKPAETEVGRGTLQSDGSIARQPTGGTLTDFSQGRKSIALIAAAEWFNAVEAIRGAPAPASDRMALAALTSNGAVVLAESGREGLFVFETSDQSAEVAADPMQGVHVAPVSDPTGASGAWVRRYPGFISVKWFGARGDSDEWGEIGNDDTAAIQAAIDYVDSIGGGTLYFPEGYYRITSYLTLCKKLRVTGAGRQAAWIVSVMVGGNGSNAAEDLRNGSAFYCGWPSNSSSAAHISIENLGFNNPNWFNIGACFYDNGGTTISITNCQFTGFKYGIVFDQTELADVTLCEFRWQNDFGAGVYLVNGPTFTAGNGVTYTNRISVTRSHFNQAETVYGILDEGGYTHSFIDNNFTACLNHIYAAGVQGLQIIGGQFEASTGNCIELDYRRVADQTGVGGGTGVIEGCLISVAAKSCINIAGSSGPYSIRNCFLGRGDKKIPITGAPNASWLNLSGNYTNSSTQELIDSQAGNQVADDRISMSVKTNFALASINLTKDYVEALVQCTKASGQTVKIQDDVTTALPIGTCVYLEQTTGAGIVTVVPGTGVTLTGPVSTKAQYQVLQVRKMAVNNWRCTLVGGQALAGPATDSGLTASAGDTLLGRSSAGAGAIEEIACTAAGRELIAAVDPASQRAALGVPAAAGFHFRGAPGAGDLIGGAIASTSFTIDAAKSACRAAVPAAAQTSIAIRINGADAGTFDFAAGATSATATIGSASVAAGDQLTFHAPASPDATLADIDGLVRE